MIELTQSLSFARDPLGRAVQVDFVGEFAPLGMKLRFETNSPKLLESFSATFGRYGTNGELGQFTIRLLEDRTLTESPPWPHQIVRGQGALLYITVGSQNIMVADLNQGYAFGFITPAMADDLAFLRSAFLECLVFSMATHGEGGTHTYVHASAVARGDRGIILSGLRESGKSTLAYACARRGFKLVTDDVAYLSGSKNGLTAWGKPWRFRFLPDCFRFFPELAGAGAVKSTEGDIVEVETEEVLPGCTQAQCRPTALFFLDRSGGPVGCETLPPEEAVKLLARDLICDAPGIMERHCRTWMQLARRGCYLLHYGEDLDSVVLFLERFLSEHPAE